MRSALLRVFPRRSSKEPRPRVSASFNCLAVVLPRVTVRVDATHPERGHVDGARLAVEAHGHEDLAVLELATHFSGRWNFPRRALERHARRAALGEVRIGPWERYVFITDVRASSDRLREAPGVLPIVVVIQSFNKIALLTNFEINTSLRAAS